MGKAHVLRHSFARAGDAREKVLEIQTWRDHKSLATTRHYLAASRADKNPHNNALTALLEMDAKAEFTLTTAAT